MYEFDVFLMSHNNHRLAVNCVDALYENTKHDFRLTILDDSNDFTTQYLAWLAKEKDNVNYIHQDKPFDNPGQMMSLALAQTDCPYIVTLNNSCRVEPGWIGSALNIMGKHKDVGVVGFKMVRGNGLIENAGVLLYGGEVRNIGMDEAGHRFNYIYEVDAVGMAACLFRREMLSYGYDSAYYLPFAGFDDLDLCLRIKEKWKIIYCGYGVVYHDGAATRGKDPAFWEKFYENKRRFSLRWKHLLDRETSAIKAMQ